MFGNKKPALVSFTAGFKKIKLKINKRLTLTR